MATIRQSKYVSSLPGTLDHDTIYYVRVGRGFDIYVTNHSGTVVSYRPNIEMISKPNYELPFPDESPSSSIPEVMVTAEGGGRFVFTRHKPSRHFIKNTEVHDLVTMHWSGTTNNGTFLVYPTSDNTASGTALFSQIVDIQCIVTNNTTTWNDIHLPAIRTISGDLKTITFNIVRGSIAVVGGTGLREGSGSFAATATIVGYLA